MPKRLFCITLFSLICLSIPVIATAQIVDIPDANLRVAIERYLGIAPGAAIREEDMAQLTELEANRKTITSLTGLELASNLTRLSLPGNFISDISPLAGLTNLDALNLGDNSISDISAIAGLTNLKFLWLEYNSISDISALAGLTQLRTLWMSKNSVSDLSPLVENTGIGDRDTVDVTGNFLNALSINTHIPTLQSRGVTVRFDNIIVPPEDIVQIVDIPDPNLRDAINATRGNPPDTPISVADMLVLTIFFAFHGNISDLTGIEHATNLTFLSLDSTLVAEDFIKNSVSDLSPLAGLTDLTWLLLPDNSISDISAIAGLTNLEVLDLAGNSISDISPLTGLTNLIALGLYNNSISDISPLAGLTNLTLLWLNDNSISDISPLAGLTQLTHLRLDNNSISDISSLVENTGLGNESVVDARRNPLSILSINTHIPALQSRGVKVYFDDTVTQAADVNGDGVVNIFDLVSVASHFGKRGEDLATDVNRDGIVDVRDLVLVAGRFGEGAAAPSAQPQAAEILFAAAVRGWLIDAKALEIRDPIMRQGVMVLQQLLAALTPTETELLANYPNPFNPETWIPYRLAKNAFVTLTIYNGAGQIVRTIDIGHQTASAYESRSQAIYWDGRNQIGEKVASGVYFYHLSAGDFSATRKMLILK